MLDWYRPVSCATAPYKLIFEFITRTLQQYGGYAQVSDIVDENRIVDCGEGIVAAYHV
jgi:hypothetical protein